MKDLVRLAVLALVTVGSLNAIAVPITVSGTLNSLPVNAGGTLTAGTGSVVVTLSNLQADPKSIIQLISGLSFDVTGSTGSGMLSAVGMGESISIGSAGNYSVINLSDPLTRWTATGSGTHIVALTTLSGGSPSMLIIGPPNASNQYANANPSITGDNPSVFETATFTIAVPGVTSDSTFANVTFYFGTGGTTLVGNVPDGGTTMCLLGIALLAIGSFRKKLIRA